MDKRVGPRSVERKLQIRENNVRRTYTRILSDLQNLNQSHQLSLTTLAWFTGVFEGDGHLTKEGFLEISQHDKSLLYLLKANLHMGSIYSSWDKPTEEQMTYNFTITNRHQALFVLPYLEHFVRSNKRVRQIQQWKKRLLKSALDICPDLYACILTQLHQIEVDIQTRLVREVHG